MDHQFIHLSRCPGGGIGRRAGLKILWQLMPYRFDSGPGHQDEIVGSQEIESLFYKR